MTSISNALTQIMGSATPNDSEIINALILRAKDARDLAGRKEFTVDVDRKFASSLLENLDELQRSISHSKVNEIRSDIESGNWMSTGDPIRLSPAGKLVDGQHRLTAFVQANVPADFVLPDTTIVVLESRQALNVVDTGKSRSVIDLRKMTGRERVPAKAIGGILYEHRDFDTNEDLSKLQRNEIVDNHPFLSEVTEMASHKTVKVSTTPVIAAAIRCMRVPGAKDEAFAFFNAALQNKHDINGMVSSQLELLSNWLITNSHSGGGHAIRRETVVRCIHAWNAYREGRTLKHLRYYRSSGIPKAV